MDMQQMLAEYEVRRVRQVWAFARDHAEWDTMRACFHPDATICVAWYTGPVANFLERTIAMAAERRPEELSKHWFGNSRVSVNGDRAILETDAQVLNRSYFDGHLFDFTIYLRLYDRLERRQGQWKILRMDGIYDKDRLDPVIPGSIPSGFFDGLRLSGPESAVGMMRWRLEKRGRTVSPDIALAGTDDERKLRADAEAWLARR
ncbi:MAG TPA: nuclear transport factor 2 family protein [Stellaceae bacterium]|nr:nuclear transport factor 2 family protein [Stellaceae bacterium]